MDNKYTLQEKEKPGEREERERRKREREEWERKTGNPGAGPAVSVTAQEYGQKIAETASLAKDYISDRISVVGDKFKEMQKTDLAEMTENAKDYARRNPGKAILISAVTGLIIGLLIRESRR